MSNWFYYDSNGLKVGPVTGEQLKGFADEGLVTLGTTVESEEGRFVLAEKMQDLMSDKTQSDGAKSSLLENFIENEIEGFVEGLVEGLDDDVDPSATSPESVLSETTAMGYNPFSAPMPVAENPFTAPVPDVGSPFSAPISAADNPFSAPVPAMDNPFSDPVPGIDFGNNLAVFPDAGYADMESVSLDDGQMMPDDLSDIDGGEIAESVADEGGGIASFLGSFFE